MQANPLMMQCSKCRVAETCPRRGSSPLPLPKSGTRKVFCYIIGGYGREPVEKRKLSAESLARSEKDGPCMTLARVPYIDEETGTLQYEMVKVFSQPMLHPRETIPFNINLIYPTNPATLKKP